MGKCVVLIFDACYSVRGARLFVRGSSPEDLDPPHKLIWEYHGLCTAQEQNAKHKYVVFYTNTGVNGFREIQNVHVWVKTCYLYIRYPGIIH